MDRLTPTLQPDRIAIGHQRWQDLLFLHWPVPAEQVRPLMPRSLDLDLYDGQAWITLLPFAAHDVRPAGVPRALGIDFLETNLRTYVHLSGRDPGIFFFSLDAASRLTVYGARVTLGLPYYYARMHMEGRDSERRFQAMRKGTSSPCLDVHYRIGKLIGQAEPGSLEFFLIERYLLHVEHLGKLLTEQIHHPPYQLYHAEIIDLRDELIAAAGLTVPTGKPLAHYAPGFEIDLYWPRVSG